MLPPRRTYRDLLAGRHGQPITVATLPEQTAILMSSTAREVKMARDYAVKISNKMLTWEDLFIAQDAIMHGYIFLGRRSNVFEFLYFQKKLQKEYLLVLKTARWGQEVWFVTFHRIAVQDYRAKSRKLTQIRDHS